MEHARSWGVVSLAVLFAASPLKGEERNRSWPQNPKELQLNLSVVFALEDGPFVCKVILKNVSKRSLQYADDRFTEPAHCGVIAEWQTKKQPLIRLSIGYGMIGPFVASIPPEGASQMFYLHRSFCEVPPGDVSVQFGWDVYRTIRNPMKKAQAKEVLWQPEILDRLFSLERTQSVKVLPATKENVTRVLRALEADFARVALECKGRNDYHSRSDEPAYDLVQTLGSCRHKEFVPLLLRAMDCLPGSHCRGELVGTVYDSFPTPAEGFNALANYLDSPRAAAAVEVFAYWKREQVEHEESKRRQEKLRNKPKIDTDSKQFNDEQSMWAILQSEEDAWRTCKRHLDTRLTREQLGRLLAVKNVWIRALLYTNFPEMCPADWVAALRTDLRRITRPPKRMQQLIAQLDDDSFEVRERASQELMDWRDSFAVYLWSVPKDKLSLEASHRLREVLRGLNRTELPPLPRRVLLHLAFCDKPEARQFLDILRTTEPENLITREAQNAFEKHQKYEEEMKRLREGK